MGFFDKVRDIVNPQSIDDNYDEDEYVFAGGDSGEYNYDGDYQQPQQQPNYTAPHTAPQSSQYGMSSGMEINGNALELKVIKPKHWDNVNQIADHLISKRTVVLNLEDTNKEEARRMIDFLLGVVYTIEGDIKKVANNTWVITPNNVDLSQDAQPAPQNQQNQGMGY